MFILLPTNRGLQCLPRFLIGMTSKFWGKDDTKKSVYTKKVDQLNIACFLGQRVTTCKFREKLHEFDTVHPENRSKRKPLLFRPKDLGLALLKAFLHPQALIPKPGVVRRDTENTTRAGTRKTTAGQYVGRLFQPDTSKVQLFTGKKYTQSCHLNNTFWRISHVSFLNQFRQPFLSCKTLNCDKNPNSTLYWTNRTQHTGIFII